MMKFWHCFHCFASESSPVRCVWSMFMLSNGMSCLFCNRGSKLGCTRWCGEFFRRFNPYRVPKCGFPWIILICCLFACLSICLICVCFCLSVICLSIHSSVYLLFCLSGCLSLSTVPWLHLYKLFFWNSIFCFSWLFWFVMCFKLAVEQLQRWCKSKSDHRGFIFLVQQRDTTTRPFKPHTRNQFVQRRT